MVKSCRNGDKVRQITILVMLDIRVPQAQWKALATAIEALINGQDVLFHEKAIQEEAERWFHAYLCKKSREALPLEINPRDDEDYESVSISSILNRQPKSIGAEHISLSMYRKLGFEDIFTELGFSNKQRNDAALSILGRMLEPGSENATAAWGRTHTGLGELLGADFSRLSHNALYRITDQIYKNKEQLEQSLRVNECSVFNLTEGIFLYDLTNTYLEGTAAGIAKARFGHSKEKRFDCRLLTLGLVLDELGFPKRSKVMEGSVSESGTLEKMLEYLRDETDLKPVTVVIDAGIATEANLAYLRKHKYHYICVARNKPIPEELIDKTKFMPVSNKGGNQIHTQVFRQENECVLYCESEKMGLKEQAMREKFCSRFEAELNNIRDALAAKKGKRKYEFVYERVIRLKERFKSVSSFYTIDIVQEEDKAVSLHYSIDRQGALDAKYSGSYYLRTSHMDLSSDKIWSMYMMLNTVERAFRTLKSELHFKPVYHQKDSRAEAHLFVAVLAYHLVNAIQHQLHEQGINISWTMLRKMMRNHQLILTTMQTRKGTTITIVDSTVAEDNHIQIYNALNLSHNPIKRIVRKHKHV
ncbi:MAG: IS1634 family transposase [Candidatus Cloacimonadaceae bacterium]|nr:IS1634 family transposase [Candidatus Cloacimonadaceae bacterium]